MRAIITTGHDDLTITEIPAPEPGVGQVLVRVEAAGVNPVDIGTRFGAFHQAGAIPEGAATGLGWDVVGVIEAVGPAVTGFTRGDRVAALIGGFDIPLRAYADFTLVPADAIALVPEGLDAVGAVTIPLNATTAAQALDLITPDAGNTLLITGAAGAVGGFAISLAKRRGWAPTALARVSDGEFLRAAGATAQLTELPTNQKFDAVLDAAGLGAPALAVVRDGGAYVGVTPGNVPETERGISTVAVGSHHDGVLLAEFLTMAATGELAVRVAGTVPLADAAQAHQNVQKGGQRGRWVLIP